MFYTSSTMGLVIPLQIKRLLVEPKNGSLTKEDVQKSKDNSQQVSAFTPTHQSEDYRYMPQDDFIGVDQFIFENFDAAKVTVTIHVKNSADGNKIFVPIIS